jgi:DNA-binding MarR family transcriptional regulator
MTNIKKSDYNKDNYHLLGKILAAPNKKKIMYSLSIPLTPKEITKKTDLNFPTVSKNIKDLEDLGLLSIQNKDLKKGKVVIINSKGKELLKDLEKREQEKKEKI